MLQPQNLFDEFASNARPEQNANNHPIQEVLNLGHALVPITQRAINAVVAFGTDGFMHGKLCVYGFHDQKVIEPEAVNW